MEWEKGENEMSSSFKFDEKGLDMMFKNIEKELTKQAYIEVMPMKRDSEILLGLFLERYEKTKQVVVDMNVRECSIIPNISHNLRDILDDLEAHGCIGSQSTMFLGGGFVVYLTTDGIEYFKNKQQETKKIPNNITWNVQGGQINIANDNAIVNATQNNGTNLNELEIIIKGILDNLSELSEEDAETIEDSIGLIQEELTKPEPKKARISSGIKLIAPMISIANGIPVLADNLQKFVGFVSQYIH